jgi:TonB-linked SusC/RagA family outer membrane protein
MLAIFAIGAARVAAAQGSIAGRVVTEGNMPLGDVRVLVVTTAAFATTDGDGRFTLKGVPAGTFDIQALHLGFQSQKKTVTVVAGATTTADIVMKPAVVQLQEVVTTATGQQRRIELGNSIATFGDVAKHVEGQPIMAMQDLLVAKAPGVNVLPGSVVGGAATIRVRGVSSISLSNAPIWVVDGVRYLVDQTDASAGLTPIGLLNNLSPEEIEDIEIVRGPSAATLYGTNAANGVVIVTTKRGRAGSTRWSFGAESRTIDDRSRYQAQYANWGHSPAAPASNIRCQLSVMQTPAFKIADGATCISDSVTSYNYLTDPEQTFIKLGRGSLFTAQVSGGPQAVRFFTSATLDNEFGPIQMPAADIRWYDDVLHVPVTNQMLHPRQQQKLNFRSNVSAQLSPTLDLTASAGFSKSGNIIEPDNSLIIGLLYVGQANYGWKGCPAGTELTGCGMTGPDAKPYYDATGFPLHDSNGFAPGSIMQYLWTDDVQRFTGSTTLSWRPVTWIQNEATAGIDWANQDQFHLCRLNECPNQGANSRVGNVYTQSDGRRNFSTKAASTASWRFSPAINFKTSAGAEYTNTEHDQTWAQGRNLAPGASTLAAATTFVGYSHTEPTAVKTLGYYLQEQLGLHDRVFLTVAGRQDQNSAFGSKFQRVTYPKASLSWLVSDEPFVPRLGWLTSFRLRAAYGANGVQPQATAALQTFRATTQTIAKVDAQTGVDLPGLIASQPGNASLRPEKSAEFETGFDADFFARRMHVEYTWYVKNTSDALVALPIPASVAAAVTSIPQNVGKTRNWGNEVQLTAQLLERRSVAWDVTISGSHNDNKWVDLGKDPSTCVTDANGRRTCDDLVIGLGGTTQQRKGDPLFTQWYRGYTYADRNGDGIIQRDEVQVSSRLSRIGVGFAKDLASVQTGFDLMQRRLRVSASFDYRGGGNTLEGNYFQCSSTPKACRDSQDPTAPLWMQARAVAVTYGTVVNGTTFSTPLGYFVPDQFWKWRELSASLLLPDRINRLFAARSGSTLAFGLRNIHTWTSFTGVDPEQNYGVNGSEVTNDFNTSPPPTYITFRLNLKY